MDVIAALLTCAEIIGFCLAIAVLLHRLAHLTSAATALALGLISGLSHLFDHITVKLQAQFPRVKCVSQPSPVAVDPDNRA